MSELGRRILIGLALLAIMLVLVVAAPFAEVLLMAAVMAAAMSPLYERLAKWFRQQRAVAGAVFVAAVVFAIVLPVVGVVLAVAEQADDAFQPIRATFQEEGLDGVINGLPHPLAVLVRDVMKRMPRGGQTVEELVRSSTGKVLGGVGYFFVATGNLMFQISMMLVAFFFLLVDGPHLVRWIITISPLTEEQMKELLDGFRDVSIAVLLGSLGTALIQTLVALLGYWIAGAKHALLLSVATFIGAFIPVVGAGAVVIGTAVILFLTGHSTSALFLALWGVAVVSSIDNFVKPLLMRGKLEVNTGVTFFALLGGVATFGPVGLLVGPLTVAFFLAVVRMCQKELAVAPVPLPAQAPPPAPPVVAESEAPPMNPS